MVRVREVVVGLWALGALILVSSAGGCGSNHESTLGGDDTGDDDASSSGSGGSSGGASSGGASSGASGGGMFVSGPASDAAACTGGALACDVPAGCTTSISGTVYDPAGVNPLYNVVVFVPNDPGGALSPIARGTDT